MAAKYWVGGNVSPNWNASAPTNWSLTSGGANNAPIPLSTDDVIFDGAGPTGNTNSTISAVITIGSFTVTPGYTATMTHNANITIAGNITLNNNYTVAGTIGWFILNATSIMTSNGKVWPNTIQMINNSTKTLADEWTILGALSIINAQTINGATLHLKGGLSSTGTIAGTSVISFEGTGSFGSTGGVSSSFVFNTTGTITITNVVAAGGATFTYIAGTINHTGTLSVGVGAVTFNTNGMSWNIITNTGNSSPALNLISNLSVATLSMTGSAGNSVFTGTGNVIIANLIANVVGPSIWTLNHLATCTITTSFTTNGRGPATAQLVFTSDDAALKATLIVQPAAVTNVSANFTRIDASAGKQIPSFNGIITDCLNIFAFTDNKQINISSAA